MSVSRDDPSPRLAHDDRFDDPRRDRARAEDRKIAAGKWRDLGDVGAVGIEFVLSIVVCYYGGRWIDGRWLGGHGVGTAIGAVLGVLTAFKAIYDASRRMKRRLAEIERDEQRAAEPWERARTTEDRQVDRGGDRDRDVDGRERIEPLRVDD